MSSTVFMLAMLVFLVRFDKDYRKTDSNCAWITYVVALIIAVCWDAVTLL